MSEVLGFLTLAGAAALLCWWFVQQIREDRHAAALGRIERIAYQEYRPVDRVAIVSSFLGDTSPAIARRISADDLELEAPTRAHLQEKAEDTRRAIGAVRLAAAMAPCDEAGVVTSIFYHRDLGDETPAF